MKRILRIISLFLLMGLASHAGAQQAGGVVLEEVPVPAARPVVARVVRPEDRYDVRLYPNTVKKLAGYHLVRVEGTPVHRQWKVSDLEMVRNPRYSHLARVIANLERHGKLIPKLIKLPAEDSNHVRPIDPVFGNMQFDNIGDVICGWTPAGWPVRVNDPTVWTDVWEKNDGGVIRTWSLCFKEVTNFDLCGNVYHAHVPKWYSQTLVPHEVVKREYVPVPVLELEQPKIDVKVVAPNYNFNLSVTFNDLPLPDSQGPTARIDAMRDAPQGSRTVERLLDFSLSDVTIPQTVVKNGLTNINNLTQSQGQSQSQGQAQTQQQTLLPQGATPPPVEHPVPPPSPPVVVVTPPDNPPGDSKPPLPSSS